MPDVSVQPYRLEPWIDLQAHLDGLEVISLSLGPDAMLYLLAIIPPAHYRERRAGASFARITPGKPNAFVVLQCDAYAVNRVEISNQSWNFHHVQPLPNDELLLVCARSRYRGQDDYDANGHVFSADGRFVRSFLLGDGIQDVQTTRDGRIWTSYFDEGIFGNYGWNDPIGASGLICWDGAGTQRYAYMPSRGLDRMCDCYALNVATDRDTWCYYYTEFPLVHLRDNRMMAAWECPIKGADGFTVFDDWALMRGGYRARDTYHLLHMQRNGRIQEQARYTFVDEHHDALTGGLVCLRADTLVILQGTRCYRVSLPDLLSTA
jgi:hypothetical protein